MSGRRSREKGARTERAIVRLLQAQGIAPTKIISRTRSPGADRCMPIMGLDREVGVKCPATGFNRFYDWLNDRDALKADRQERFIAGRAA
jgi:hypothetical protein